MSALEDIKVGEIYPVIHHPNTFIKIVEKTDNYFIGFQFLESGRLGNVKKYFHRNGSHENRNTFIKVPWNLACTSNTRVLQAKAWLKHNRELREMIEEGIANLQKDKQMNEAVIGGYYQCNNYKDCVVYIHQKNRLTDLEPIYYLAGRVWDTRKKERVWDNVLFSVHGEQKETIHGDEDADYSFRVINFLGTDLEQVNEAQHPASKPVFSNDYVLKKGKYPCIFRPHQEVIIQNHVRFNNKDVWVGIVVDEEGMNVFDNGISILFDSEGMQIDPPLKEDRCDVAIDPKGISLQKYMWNKHDEEQRAKKRAEEGLGNPDSKEQTRKRDQHNASRPIKIDFELRAVAHPMEGNHVNNVKSTIEISPEMACFKFDGYGACCMRPGYGFPVALEHYEGSLRLLVWGDINEEDPTHVISLEGARETNRKHDGDSQDWITGKES